jgi:hypothetical protein
MSTSSHHQFRFPKPTTIAGLGLSAGALYVVWSTNERKKRLQGQYQEIKDGFERVKEEQMEKLKQAKEDFKCMPAVQEAKQRAKEHKVKWEEGKERFKENRVLFKDAMKRNKAYQELAATMPDLVNQAEAQIDDAWETLTVVNSDERVSEMLDKYPEDAEEIKLVIETCQGSMDRATELLGQEEKSLGWTITVAAELNNLHTQTKKLKAWIDDTEGSEMTVELEN